jgi:hypothetical protein
MNEAFNMSNWRRKYVLMAENDNDSKNTTEYVPEIHGKITSYEDSYFEPEDEPFDVTMTVGAEKDLENAKEIHLPFVKLEEWADEEELPFETIEDYRIAAIKYFEAYFSQYLNDEGKKSLRAQLSLYEAKEEEPVKKPTKTEIVDQIKHFLQEKY